MWTWNEFSAKVPKKSHYEIQQTIIEKINWLTKQINQLTPKIQINQAKHSAKQHINNTLHFDFFFFDIIMWCKSDRKFNKMY